MMRHFQLFLVLVLASTGAASCQTYVEFDEVVHYYAPLPPAQLDSLEDVYYNDPVADAALKAGLEIILGSSPRALSNTALLPLQSLTRTKIQTLSASQVAELQLDVFRVRDCSLSSVSECIPVYRDIFVFKQGGELTGIAKICFECGQYQFIGFNPTYPTLCFGMNGEYKMLRKILGRNESEE